MYGCIVGRRKTPAHFPFLLSVTGSDKPFTVHIMGKIMQGAFSAAGQLLSGRCDKILRPVPSETMNYIPTFLVCDL